MYVNKEFGDVFNKIYSDILVFEKIGACKYKELKAKCNVFKDNYTNITKIEAKTIIDMANKKIIPQALSFLSSLTIRAIPSINRHV